MVCSTLLFAAPQRIITQQCAIELIGCADKCASAGIKYLLEKLCHLENLNSSFLFLKTLRLQTLRLHKDSRPYFMLPMQSTAFFNAMQ